MCTRARVEGIQQLTTQCIVWRLVPDFNSTSGLIVSVILVVGIKLYLRRRISVNFHCPRRRPYIHTGCTSTRNYLDYDCSDLMF